MKKYLNNNYLIPFQNKFEPQDSAPRKKARNRKFLLAALYFSVIVLISIFISVHIWQYVVMSEVKFSISRLKREKSELSKQTDFLIYQYESLISAERIEKAAREKLGMAPPDNVIYIHLDKKETDTR